MLALIAEGRSNTGIARRLFVTDGTVEKHISSILVKLNLHEADEDHRRVLAANHRYGGRAVILISTYSAADLAGAIAGSPATGFLPKPELSADAIRRIVDGRGPGRPPGAAVR